MTKKEKQRNEKLRKSKNGNRISVNFDSGNFSDFVKHAGVGGASSEVHRDRVPDHRKTNRGRKFRRSVSRRERDHRKEGRREGRERRAAKVRGQESFDHILKIIIETLRVTIAPVTPQVLGMASSWRQQTAFLWKNHDYNVVFAKQFIQIQKRDTKKYTNKSLHTFNKCSIMWLTLTTLCYYTTGV